MQQMRALIPKVWFLGLLVIFCVLVFVFPEGARMFVAYLWAVSAHGWWLLTSGPYALDPVLDSQIDSYRSWRARNFSFAVWQRMKIILALVGLFLAGFFAWRDEHQEVENLKAQGSPSVVGKLQGDLAQAQGQVTSLQKKLAPRRISPEQKEDLVRRLRGKDRGRSVMIKIVEGSPPEAWRYAEDFADVFRELKWPGEIKGWWYLQIEDAAVRCHPHDLTAAFLHSQLQALSVELQLIETMEVAENSIEIVVGPKSYKDVKQE
jgi:hypothetical protein